MVAYENVNKFLFLVITAISDVERGLSDTPYGGLFSRGANIRVF
jgi:hypothetical protein